MILKQAYISDFKALKDITIDFEYSEDKPITMIVGSSRTGKTTFLNLTNILLKEFFGKYFHNYINLLKGYVKEGILAKYTLLDNQNNKVEVEFSIIPYTLEYPNNPCITHTPLDNKLTLHCKASIPISQLKKQTLVESLTVLDSTFLAWHLIEFLRTPKNKAMFLKDMGDYSDVVVDKHEDNIYFDCVYNNRRINLHELSHYKRINLHDLSYSEISAIYLYVLIKTAKTKIFLLDTSVAMGVNIENIDMGDCLKEWSKNSQFIIATKRYCFYSDVAKVVKLPN